MKHSGATHTPAPASDDRSPDREDRIRDFLERHGGAAGPMRETSREDGSSGHWEVSAADGHTLRCTWSRTGSRQEMQFSEIPPGAAAAAAASRGAEPA